MKSVRSSVLDQHVELGFYSASSPNSPEAVIIV